MGEGTAQEVTGSAAYKPCPYCWVAPCDGTHNPMWECPECAPEGGFGPIHAECQESVDRYVSEAAGV